jgi:hypothetical protein
MKGNEVCCVGRPKLATLVAACLHEMQDRIAASGSWTEVGQQLFGIVVNGATAVSITTNHGDTQPANGTGRHLLVGGQRSDSRGLRRNGDRDIRERRQDCTAPA